MSADLGDRVALDHALNAVTLPFGEPDILVHAAVNLRPPLDALGVE